MTTTNYKKPKKKKLSAARLAQLEVEWRKHNKELRRSGLHELQFQQLDDFIDYVHGVYKRPKREKEFVPYTPKPTYQRETNHIPSLNSMPTGVAAKPEPKVYTGTLIKGIATMHKSNAVPIIDEQQAIDIAHMRR